jgi:hypothetical protein
MESYSNKNKAIDSIIMLAPNTRTVRCHTRCDVLLYMEAGPDRDDPIGVIGMGHGIRSVVFTIENVMTPSGFVSWDTLTNDFVWLKICS